ncbi:alpha/beta fold hydrolase [Microbacterium sp. DT81.1]|uniref:alpha/beta fold hydrolase n=1 Tax=Microbacterium sp. DT81.1 TaxID=3393413 RepID=UPI003CF02FF1
MESRINGALVHYVERGRGTPLVALHGAGVDHREMEAAMEAVVPLGDCRRVYPDLPGMGRSTAEGLVCNDDVVRRLGTFIDDLGAGPVLLVGHSYGAYLAGGLAAHRPDLVLGLALLCPLGEQSQDLPQHVVVREDADAHDELDPAQHDGFDEYFVVRTADTARRYRDHVVPGTTLVDEGALGRIFEGWAMDPGSAPYAGPTLIVAGRRDSTAGCSEAMRLFERHPRATLAVVEDAGHALMHERPELLAALLAEWIARVNRLTEHAPAGQDVSHPHAPPDERSSEMSNPEPHATHAEDARADDAPPTDGVTDEVREDSAEAEFGVTEKSADEPG